MIVPSPKPTYRSRAPFTFRSSVGSKVKLLSPFPFVLSRTDESLEIYGTDFGIVRIGLSGVSQSIGLPGRFAAEVVGIDEVAPERDVVKPEGGTELEHPSLEFVIQLAFGIVLR